ncbi:MAG TPA: hypothetical protein VNM92_04430 [Thermoanaerobaculia bacterium]|nr:hypothetical protein [Thermoanaerobaculia bacterium]
MRNKLVALSLAISALATTGAAQNTDIEALAGIQFNFANPGARSLAMGGAFLGLADDASAAEANPAGLTILRKPEVSLELRNFQNFQSLNTGGTVPDLTTTDFSSFSRRVEPVFASLVYPIKNFAVAGYYHQTLNYRNSGSVLPTYNGTIKTAEVPTFYIPVGTPPGSALPVSEAECDRIIRQTGNVFACGGYTTTPFVTAVSVNMKTWGVAGAWNLGKVSIGVGARYQNFTEGAFTTRYTDNFRGSLTPESIVVQASGLDDEGNPETQTDVTFTAGFKWNVLDNLSFGGVYKEGAKFDAPVFSQSSANPSFGQTASPTFHIPDIAGLGVTYKPGKIGPIDLNQALTLSADGVFVKYSNLTDDFSSSGFGTQFLSDQFTSKDAVEIHLGGEYFFSTKIPIAVRAGWWRDPAHSIQYGGPLTCDDSRYPAEQRVLCAANRVAATTLFPESKDQDHLSVGIGLAWPRFQIDAAYETSNKFKVGSLSMVTRF